jgi:hypothetical protein
MHNRKPSRTGRRGASCACCRESRVTTLPLASSAPPTKPCSPAGSRRASGSASSTISPLAKPSAVCVARNGGATARLCRSSARTAATQTVAVRRARLCGAATAPTRWRYVEWHGAWLWAGRAAGRKRDREPQRIAPTARTVAAAAWARAARLLARVHAARWSITSSASWPIASLTSATSPIAPARAVVRSTLPACEAEATMRSERPCPPAQRAKWKRKRQPAQRTRCSGDAALTDETRARGSAHQSSAPCRVTRHPLAAQPAARPTRGATPPQSIGDDLQQKRRPLGTAPARPHEARARPRAPLCSTLRRFGRIGSAEWRRVSRGRTRTRRWGIGVGTGSVQSHFGKLQLHSPDLAYVANVANVRSSKHRQR